jgi:hypothetical protein
MKPYTYDLRKYSIYFNTGFIEGLGWHSPEGDFQLDPQDTGGELFSGGFEMGFRLLGRLGYLAFPSGSLVPRFDTDVGGFKERGPPRSDATVFLFMIIGYSILLGASRRFVGGNGNNVSPVPMRNLVAAPVILGSVFFILGSQNVLRQFLGVSIVVLALSMLTSRHYITCMVLVLLSGAFHKWAPILGLLGVFLTVIGNVGTRDYSIQPASPIHWSLAEMISLAAGIATILLIKLIMVFGIYHMPIPLVDDLKSYVIRADEFESLERISSFIKAGAIFVIFSSSELFLGKISRSDGTNIRLLRRRLLIFLIPFLIYPEIFSRLIVLYWAMETIFVVWALNSEKLRSRLAGATVFVAYGFAPNAINVLIGPDWLYNL